ncbi:MAG: 2Fe-2S iron-sulfur cluster binding domain-containing protein [Ahniella sp.]|nr:2Fe-2S iron-sulfur cluster binding domain-containing protein [Ahniella sp.]
MLAQVINPVWSFTEIQARVVRVIDEAPGVKSLWLKPNRRFGAFVAGQHLLLELSVNGARLGRCFSLSHAPRADRQLRLTIKLKDDGPVSHAAHALTVGSIVRLSKAQGDFAPKSASTPLLLLAAGSGITPIMSHLHTLAASQSTRDVVLVNSIRTERDLIFGEELRELALLWPQLRIHLHVSQESGRLDPDALAALVPDWAERETLLCGPVGFMQSVAAMYAAAGHSERLHSESFGRAASVVDPDAAQHEVSFAVSGNTFTAQAGQNLLEAAEASGLKPRFGCRRGICRTCQCRKQSGTVLNQLTGQISGPGEELIQLCISTPQSAIDIAL